MPSSRLVRGCEASDVERQNLTMRMSMGRFTRLRNGFSKRLENHIAAVAIHSEADVDDLVESLPRARHRRASPGHRRIMSQVKWQGRHEDNPFLSSAPCKPRVPPAD